jgi:hypothetical protein
MTTDEERKLRNQTENTIDLLINNYQEMTGYKVKSISWGLVTTVFTQGNGNESNTTNRGIELNIE